MSQPSRRLRRSLTLALRVETLEDRLTPSWGGLPPSALALPASPVAVALNASGDASGQAAITNNEVDWYRFTVAAGSATFSASTPTSNLDTVLGLYNASGRRVASNDDISYPGNTDSRATVTLTAGTYYLGVTNYVGTAGGSYTWAIDAPAVAPPVPPVPTPTGFDITLRTTGLTAGQLAIFQQAAARWSQAITGDLPAATYNGVAVDDVLIDATAAPIDGPGGILGQAGPDFVRSGTFLPIHGAMEFDSADLAQLEASGQLFSTVLHEMGHVLGIGTIWQARGLLAGAGTADPRFTGPQATAAYNQIFGRAESSVPVEGTGGPGTADGHWRETTFNNELMTGFLNRGANPLSRVTVASLGDLGYQVNLNAVDAYTPPGGAGLVAGGESGGGSGGPASLRAAAAGNVAVFAATPAPAGPQAPSAATPPARRNAPDVQTDAAPARFDFAARTPWTVAASASASAGWADEWNAVAVG